VEQTFHDKRPKVSTWFGAKEWFLKLTGFIQYDFQSDFKTMVVPVLFFFFGIIWEYARLTRSLSDPF
jgi:ABC-type dipeptide/oligopeptide/nickel transport system permease component